MSSAKFALSRHPNSCCGDIRSRGWDEMARVIRRMDGETSKARPPIRAAAEKKVMANPCARPLHGELHVNTSTDAEGRHIFGARTRGSHENDLNQLEASRQI
jgi:hypothetical protein